MRHYYPKELTILDAKGATGVGTTTNVRDYEHIILSFATDGGNDAALTVKFQGSIQESTPDFSAAQSVTNHWDYIEVVDLQNGSHINGDIGVSVATADDYRLFELNINGLRWLNAVVTSRTQGEVTVKVQMYNDF